MRDEHVHPHFGEDRRSRPRPGDKAASHRQYDAGHPAGPSHDGGGSMPPDSGLDWNRSGSLRQDYGDYGHAMDDRRQAQQVQDGQRRHPNNADNEPHPYAAYHRGRAPKGYTRTDERIREDVCEQIMSDPNIDAGEVSVRVKEGVVTLEGSVGERSMRHALEGIAAVCVGVRDVENRVTVTEEHWSGGRQEGSEAARAYTTAQRYARDSSKASASNSSTGAGPAKPSASDANGTGDDPSRFIRRQTD